MRAKRFMELPAVPAEVVKALVGKGGSGVGKPTLKDWPVADCILSLDNPRIVTEDREELDSDGLLTNVAAIGVQQPLQVRNHPFHPGKKEVLAGARRWMCCKVLGVPTVAVLDYGEMPDDAAFKITCIENAHRKELKPLEQGRAAAIALSRCNGDIKAAASLLGQSPRWIALGAKIDQGLSKIWKDALLKNTDLRHWTAGHVALIARFPADVQKQLFDRLRYRRIEDISIDELARQTEESLRLISKALFDTAACQNCPKRSGREPLLWADDIAQASDRNDQCLDAECWKKKEDAAARALFAEKAREHKGLVAVDLSKQSDYREREDLKKVYGDNLVEAYHYGTRTYETVGKDTKGAKPALVVAGAGKGTVKYIKHIKPEPRTDGTPKKSKAETEAARGKKQKLLAVRDHLQSLIEGLSSEDVRHNPRYAIGMLFCLVRHGVYDMDGLYGSDLTKFIAAWREQLQTGDPLSFLHERAWTQIKGGLKESVFADYNLHDKAGEEDLQLVAQAFGWDYDQLVTEIESELQRVESIRQRMEIVKLEVPKRHNAECELRLLEENGQWYGGFRAHLPKDSIDLPIDTRGDQYASKADCVQAQVGAIKTWLQKSKVQKKCSSLLHKDLSTALQEVLGACDLERKRTGAEPSQSARQDRGACKSDCANCAIPNCNGREKEYSRQSQASCDGDPATCDVGCKPCLAKPRPITDESLELTDGGSIVNPERIKVELPQAWKAKVEILLGQVKEKWYGGYSCHVPGAGHECPCTVNHPDYPGRAEALDAAILEINTWLRGKPGRKSYKHYGEIEGVLAGYELGGRKTSPAEAEGVTDKSARHLQVAFPKSYDAECDVSCWRIRGKWHGGFELRIGAIQSGPQPQLTSLEFDTKAACLNGMVRRIIEDLAALKDKIPTKTRTQVVARIDEAITDELAKRTCRVCGCTQDNCQQCIERTGEPCRWIEKDLCSACAGQG